MPDAVAHITRHKSGLLNRIVSFSIYVLFNSFKFTCLACLALVRTVSQIYMVLNLRTLVICIIEMLLVGVIKTSKAPGLDWLIG